MIQNELIRKMTNKILRNRKQAFFDREIMHPEREWFLGIFVALLILGVGTVWSTKTYLQFNNILLTSQEEEENIVYRASMVETALADFSARKKAYEELKSELITKNQRVEPDTPVIEEVISTSTVPNEIPETLEEEVQVDVPTGTTEGIIFE